MTWDEKSETRGFITGRSSPCSAIKVPALSNWGLFVGENKCLDQETVLLHGGDDEAGGNFPFSAPARSPQATEPVPWLPEVKTNKRKDTD